MLRRKFPSLSIRFSADFGRVAATLSASLGRSNTASSQESCNKKTAYGADGKFAHDWNELNQLECDKSRLLVLDEESEDDFQQGSLHHARKPRRSCCERTHLYKYLEGTLATQPAATVTCESKYSVHPRIAEFWCTVTSPVYLLPFFVVYQCGGVFALPPTALFALASTTATAFASGVYHTCNTELYSLMDIVLAFNTQLAFSVCAAEHVTNSGVIEDYISFTLSSYEWLATSMIGTFCLFLVFGLSPVPEVMPPLVFTLLMGPTLWVLYVCECWSTMAWLCTATGCFLADRLKLFPAHSFWHLFSAMALYEVLAFAVHANEQCGLEGLA